MKNKGLVFLTVILIIAVIGLGVGLYLVFNQKQKVDDENKKLNQSISELKEQIEDTESMVDDLNELLEQLADTDDDDNETTGELTEQDYVVGAFEKYLEEADGLKEYKIEKVKIVNKDKIESSMEEEIFQYEDSIAAEVIYSVKPETDRYMEWTVGNGEEDGEWIRNKSACVEVVNTTKGYTVMSSGTGW